MKKETLQILFDKLTQYGSGFTIEAERDHKENGAPLVYHLRMYGLIYPKDYELIGYNLKKLIKKAIKYGDKSSKKILKDYETKFKTSKRKKAGNVYMFSD